jgi:hypothetical protein
VRVWPPDRPPTVSLPLPPAPTTVAAAYYQSGGSARGEQPQVDADGTLLRRRLLSPTAAAADDGMDPSSSSARAAASARRRRTWALYSEAVATVAIAVYALTFSVEGKPTPITIIERDPTLSYPLVSPATVPGEEMVMISILVPFGVFLLSGGAAWLRYATGAKTFGLSVAYLLLALAQAILLTMAITDSIKVSVSFPRPNFFAVRAGGRERGVGHGARLHPTRRLADAAARVQPPPGLTPTALPRHHPSPARARSTATTRATATRSRAAT